MRNPYLGYTYLTAPHVYTQVEYNRIQSDGESDEGTEGDKPLVLRRNDERIALTQGAPGRERVRERDCGGTEL